jgi:hypothetical protein
MNREELELETQHLEATEELLAAKQAHEAKPTDKTAERLAAAKTAMVELRSHWRGIRDYFKADADGVAAPETLTTKARS